MIPDPTSDRTTYTYDTRHRSVTAADVGGARSWTVYDADGRVVASGNGPCPLDISDPPPDEPYIAG